ncbi:hypothetical protein D9M70_519200 [compost metagenome]
MPSYIPQYMFNICAVTAAKIAASSGKPVREAANMLATNYKESYDDMNLEDDILAAAINVTEFIKSSLPGSSIPGCMTQLQYTIINFEPDGKKRRKKIFGGTWFNKERDEIKDKVQRCKVNIAIYHMLLISGTLPLAPDGWSVGA